MLSTVENCGGLLDKNFILGWDGMPGKKTIAYSENSKIAAKKVLLHWALFNLFNPNILIFQQLRYYFEFHLS
jgi:hypothetical protein